MFESVCIICVAPVPFSRSIGSAMTKAHIHWGRLCSLALFTLLPLVGAPASDPVPLDPLVRTGQLPNGLTYYVRQNAKPEKRVELRLAVRTGSVHEDDDQKGLAHFVEHMCFNGTKSFPKNDLVHYLQSIGSNFGPDINGYTSFDETVYILTVPSDQEETLDNGFKIMREWAHEVTFDEEEVDKERGVVVEEWRLGRGANQRMSDKFIPVLFRDSKYATRIPIGERETIEGADYDTIKRYYRDWYRPDLMAFLVVGDIDPAAIEQKIKDEFGSIPAATEPRPRETYPVPDHDEPLYSVVSDPENPHNILLLFFKTDVPTYKTTADFRRRLAERLFLRMLDDRLKEVMQQPDAPFLYTAVNYGRAWVREKAAYQLFVVVPEGGIERGFEVVLAENERVRRHGFTPTELTRAKATLLKNLEQAYHERDKTESQRLVQGYLEHFLGEEPAPGIAYEYAFAQRHLGGVALGEVNDLIGRWMTPNNRVFVVQSVEKPTVPIPAEAQLQAVVARVATSEVGPYEEKQLGTSLLATKPAPGRIVGEKVIEEIGVTELTFANGVRVVLKPSDFKNDEIIFSAHRPGGQSVFPDDHHLAAQFAAACVMESGVGEFSKIDLQKMLAGKTVSVIPQIDPYYDGMKGTCAVADLETMLQLAHLYFVQPRRDEAAYTSLVTRQKAILQNILSNPMVYFQNEALKARYRGHPRTPGVLPTEQDWQTLSLDKVSSVYRDRFGSGGGYTFVFVGSFSRDAITPLLATYLGSLPAGDGSSMWKDLGLRPIVGPFDQDLRRGTDPKSFVQISLEAPAEWSRNEGHLLWSLGNILQRIYIDKLREEMSGVYGFGVGAWIGRVPYGHATFNLSIPCGPENVDKLTAAAYAEIGRIQTAGITAEELQKEVETQRRNTEKDLKENNAWLWKLELIYREGESFTRLSRPEELVQLLTLEELQRVARTYLTTDKMVRFTLYPESPES